MDRFDSINDIMNSTRRLPIVFCLDVSPSMGWQIGNNSSSIELLNAAVANLVSELKKDPRACSAAEVAFVTFSSNIIQDTEFVPLSALIAPKFQAVENGSTQMAKAVFRSIEKIEKRRETLIDNNIPYYAPFLILVTDGNRDDNDDPVLSEKAMKAVKSHCDSHDGASKIIVPIIVDVGEEVNKKTLNDYSRGLLDGFFEIKGNADSLSTEFNKVFKMIGSSTKRNIHPNSSFKETGDLIKTEMQALLLSLTEDN